MVPCAYVPLSEQSQTGRALGLTGLAPNMKDELRPMRDPVSKAQGVQCLHSWSWDLDMHTHSCTHTNEHSTTGPSAHTHTPKNLPFLPAVTWLPSIQKELIVAVIDISQTKKSKY